MLVINGRLHPRFDRRSTSLKARDGVGVRADGKVIFAISEGDDGEVSVMDAPLHYSIRPRALRVVVPTQNVDLAEEQSNE
jgi:hypothetical protein